MDHPRYPIAIFSVSLLVSVGLTVHMLPVLPRPWTMVVYGWVLYRFTRLFVCLLAWQRWTRIETHTVSAEEYPETGLLLGNGFPWTGDQVKVLLDYLHAYKALPQIASARGGVAALQAVGKASPIVLPESALNSHVAIEGSTRSGKTNLLGTIASQLIYQDQGAVVVIDPKGSPHLLHQVQRAAERLDRPFARICPYLPPMSCLYNPLSSCREPVEVVARLAPLFEKGREPFWRNQPLGVVQRVAAMHQALGMFPYHLLDICHTTLDQVRLRYLLARYLYHLGGPFNRVNELSPPTVGRLREAYEALHTRNAIVQQTLTDIETSKARWDEINGNLATALSGIIDGPFATLFDGDDALTWDQIDRERMVVVLQTHSLSTREMGRKIGKLFLQDFQGYIGHRYASGELACLAPIHLIIDEMGEMIYDDFTGAINKIGEASARLFMGWQTEADLDSEIGIQRAKVVRANVKTRLFLRIDDAETAQHLSRYCGTCNIPQRQSESMSHTYASNQSASSQARINVVEQEVPLIQPSWLASLPQGECFARIQGQLYKLAIPLPEDDLSCDS